MLSRNQTKHVQSLRLPKFRRLHGQFVAEGVKLAEELLESQYEILEIFALDSWLKINENILSRRKIRHQEINERELARISQLVTPNEVLMLVRIPDDRSGEISMTDLALFLDRIQDPGNLGTIIRTADWFGIGTIVCSPGCADLYNPKVIQSTMGSFTRVQVTERDSTEFLAMAGEKATIYGTMAGGENIYDAALDLPAVLVIGNESQGVSEELFPLLHRRIGIPRRSEKAESLNAAVAAAIICSEFRRRQ
jgi:TrmH family RNA methyltransferase